MKLDKVRIKGEERVCYIYEPIALINEISPEEEIELGEYNKALKYDYNKDWGRENSKFKLLKESYANRKVYDLYLERIESYISELPPETWDGVFTHTTK